MSKNTFSCLIALYLICANAFQCKECSSNGLPLDLCGCGVCGSFGGCTWSCDAEDSLSVVQGFQGCDRTVASSSRSPSHADGCWKHSLDECCLHYDSRSWANGGECAIAKKPDGSLACDLQSHIQSQNWDIIPCQDPNRTPKAEGCFAVSTEDCCGYYDARTWAFGQDCVLARNAEDVLVCEYRDHAEAEQWTTFDCPSQSQTGYEPVVMAHYMPWFRKNAGSHWPPSGGTYYTPVIGFYDGNDENVLRWQLNLMKAANIDGVIVDWYGTQDSMYLEKANTDALWALMQREFPEMKIAICYDFNAKIMNVDELVTDMKYLEDNFLSSQQYLTDANGIPVMLLWPSDKSVAELQSTTTFMQAISFLQHSVSVVVGFQNDHFTRDSSEIGIFNWLPDPKVAKDLSGKEEKSWAMNHQDTYFIDSSQTVVVGSVFQGWSDHYGDTGTGTVDPYNLWGRTEASNRYLDLTWEKNIQYRPDLIQLVTWNDYQEGTMIEPAHPTEGCVYSCPTDPYGYLKQVYRLISGPDAAVPNFEAITNEYLSQAATSTLLNGEEFCEGDDMIRNDVACKASPCCHWNTWESGAASFDGKGRCWSDIGRQTCENIHTGETYCESQSMLRNEYACKASACCHWNTWESGASFNGQGRCWSSIRQETCTDMIPQRNPSPSDGCWTVSVEECCDYFDSRDWTHGSMCAVAKKNDGALVCDVEMFIQTNGDWEIQSCQESN